MAQDRMSRATSVPSGRVRCWKSSGRAARPYFWLSIVDARLRLSLRRDGYAIVPQRDCSEWPMVAKLIHFRSQRYRL